MCYLTPLQALVITTYFLRYELLREGSVLRILFRSLLVVALVLVMATTALAAPGGGAEEYWIDAYGPNNRIHVVDTPQDPTQDQHNYFSHYHGPKDGSQEVPSHADPITVEGFGAEDETARQHQVYTPGNNYNTNGHVG